MHALVSLVTEVSAQSLLFIHRRARYDRRQPLSIRRLYLRDKSPLVKHARLSFVMKPSMYALMLIENLREPLEPR
jgi:hypothetical protein